MPVQRKFQAARLLRKAKADKTAQPEIDEAMVVLVNKGTPSQRLNKLLKRWGFSEADADALIKKFYPQPAA